MHRSVDASSDAPWWESAVVYCLDVETFDDANGDGVGDLAGVRRRLDYLQELGVTCLWLLPLYASPNRDDGYDVTDHCAIDPRLGTLDDFDAFVRDCETRGMRVVLELIANHTSDEHPWFLEERRDPGPSHGARYVWADEPLPEPAAVVFPGEVDESWTYDPVARGFFLHRYYPFQPDLDHSNPEVSEEIERIAAFWLDRGVAGFRGHDHRRARLAASLLLSFPGTPVLLYGDEIGLDEDLSLHGRTSVRVPMRWSSGPNGGFSPAPAAELVRPVRDAPRPDTDVSSQAGDPSSLLEWTRRAIAARRAAALGWGAAAPLETGDEAVFAHRCDTSAGGLVAVHNLSDADREIALDAATAADDVTELFADGDYDPVTPGEPVAFTIAPYGFRWLLLQPAAVPDGGPGRGSPRSPAEASR